MVTLHSKNHILHPEYSYGIHDYLNLKKQPKNGNRMYGHLNETLICSTTQHPFNAQQIGSFNDYKAVIDSFQTVEFNY